MNVALDRSEQPHTRRGLVSVLDLPLTRLRDRVKSSQDFTFGHPLPMGEGLGVRGQQVGKLDRSVNFVATK